MIAIDLFGDPVTEPPKVIRRSLSIYKTGAYPAPPGTGPQGATCKECDHYCRVQGHSKWYLKCLLMEKVWTHGAGSDIKASSPACRFFKPEEIAP